VGTSGWHYRHWAGPFYPRDLRPKAYLEFYARQFDTVEVNSTFYRLPKPETLEKWRDNTPEGFLFACKASGYITHRKRLKEPQKSCKAFFDAVERLGDKCGPILFQLPPRWHVNLERLAAFLEAFPGGLRAVFEFRDESWFHSGVYDLLMRHKAAFCIYELAGRLSPLEVTADFVYLRLHGPGAAYRGSYDEEDLAGWAERLLTWRKAGLDCFVYFDNDEKGYAVRDARRLQAKLAESK
jgi:uncharacterized protein YecE (DUF72 family)